MATPRKRPEDLLKMGRRTLYDENTVAKAYEYIASCEDEEYEFHKTRGVSSNSYEEKVKVNLPTVQGLSLHLKCSLDSLYEWAKLYPDFSEALERLKKTQHDKLIKGAISGSYNSTIAKLMLSSNHGYVERKDVTTDGDKLNPSDAQKSEANKAIDQLLGGGSNKGNAS